MGKKQAKQKNALRDAVKAVRDVKKVLHGMEIALGAAMTALRATLTDVASVVELHGPVEHQYGPTHADGTRKTAIWCAQCKVAHPCSTFERLSPLAKAAEDIIDKAIVKTLANDIVERAMDEVEAGSQDAAVNELHEQFGHESASVTTTD